MTDLAAAPAQDAPRGPLAVLGALNVRVIVPAWILAGATVKMLEAAPSFLPMHSILRPARALDLDLQWLLWALVSIEIVAAFAMILIPRLARPLAIMILSVFCGVLVYEMTRGAGSCGCFGSKSPPPATMLAVDAVMLLGAILLRPARERLLPESVRWAAAAVLGVAGAGVAWSYVDPGGEVRRADEILTADADDPDDADETTAAEDAEDADDATAADDADDADGGSDVPSADEADAGRAESRAARSPAEAGPRRNPDPQPLPQFWFSEDLAAFVERPWTELPLFGWMETWPSVPEEGTWFVTFYSRTCSDCESLFEDLLRQDRFARRTTAIEVPYSKRALRPEDGIWPMPPVRERGLEMMQLPIGPDWIVQTPLDLRIEDGVITAITEGGRLPGGSEKAPPAPHGPVWDVDPATLAEPGGAAADEAPTDADADADGAADAGGGEATEAPDAAPGPAIFARDNPSPAELPQWWFSEDLPGEVGRDWREFDLFTFMPRWPTVPIEGTRYVVFYRRDCEHCRDMYEQDFARDPELAARTTAIEVPYAKDRMTPPNAWPVPRTGVESMQMPLGPDYIITTPLAIRIEDGRIACIEEGDHATCFER